MRLFLLVFATLFTVNAQAAVRPLYQDIKLPTQVVIEKQAFGAPAVAGTADILSAHAGATSAAVATASTFVAQPDVPRNLVITPGGTTGDVESCVIVVAGTNYFGAAISENFTFAADASTAQTGSKAFKSVTSVTFPANCESGGFAATWSIGWGEKLGLKRCMDAAGDWVSSSVSGVYETSRATIAASASAVESNTADFNGTMNASATFTGYFFQNFRCQP
jgi:hypothetical protein